MYRETTHLWNRVVKRYSPQIIDTEAIRMMVEKVQAAPAHRRLGVGEALHDRGQAISSSRHQGAGCRSSDLPIASCEKQHVLFEVILAIHTAPA